MLQVTVGSWCCFPARSSSCKRGIGPGVIQVKAVAGHQNMNKFILPSSYSSSLALLSCLQPRPPAWIRRGAFISSQFMNLEHSPRVQSKAHSFGAGCFTTRSYPTGHGPDRGPVFRNSWLPPVPRYGPLSPEKADRTPSPSKRLPRALQNAYASPQESPPSGPRQARGESVASRLAAARALPLSEPVRDGGQLGAIRS